MSTAIHLGVSDAAYEKDGRTTGEVAHFLEERYGLFSEFCAQNAQWIHDEIDAAIADAVQESLATGGAVALPLDRVAENLEFKLKKAISSGAIEHYSLGPGKVPTQAALDGVNHRKKHPKTGQRRPSFVDTGIFLAHLKAWAS